MAVLHVINPGLLTTIQDRGRWGYQASGVPVAGPMDPRSHRLANALVGHGADAATLEVTLIGPEVEFDDERTVVVTGAEFELWLDGARMNMNEPRAVHAGSRLRFGRRIRGARAYVAVGGGIDVAPVLGSRATHVTAAMGGLDGRPVVVGARLPLGDARQCRGAGEAGKLQTIDIPNGRARLRVLPGPNQEYFSGAALDALQSASYRIANDSDRMGFRLSGPSLVHARGGDIISEATPRAGVQVPASGDPILLMADRQTTGGYPKIATVITADIGLAGQLAPGDVISFRVCSARDALAALIAQERLLMAAEDRL